MKFIGIHPDGGMKAAGLGRGRSWNVMLSHQSPSLRSFWSYNGPVELSQIGTAGLDFCICVEHSSIVTLVRWLFLAKGSPEEGFS